jgi:para-aminobenzoate synthetase/4-amino-4-deoxychorismate lyase
MSPELFVSVRGRTATTSPIKGTARRGLDARSDEEAREALSTSEKDRAENVMIVDLMRNDLGRVAVPGTVRVDELCTVRAMAGVWHMVSTVTGKLRDEVSDGDLLRAAFPPGSVTGAPKVRAMEIIGELEPTAREVYTGSVVLASPVAGLTSSVAIRTFEVTDGRVWIGVGGGIVADSTPASEYGECLAKARPLLSAIGAGLDPNDLHGEVARGGHPLVDPSRGVFETIRSIDGRVVDPGPHLDRLAASVRCLYGDLPLPTLAGLAEAARTVPNGRGRLRVSVCPVEVPVVTASCEPFDRNDGALGLSLRRCAAPGGLGPHKWRDRSWLERQDCRSGEVLLLIDGDGVLEASRSNLFAVLGPTVLTPPTDGRILPGLARHRVIELLRRDGFEVREERTTLDAMAVASEVFVTNSLRGVEWVGSCDGVGIWGAGPVAARARALFDHDRAACLPHRGRTEPPAGVHEARAIEIDDATPIG